MDVFAIDQLVVTTKYPFVVQHAFEAETNIKGMFGFVIDNTSCFKVDIASAKCQVRLPAINLVEVVVQADSIEIQISIATNKLYIRTNHVIVG